MQPFDAYQQWLGIDPDEHPVDHYRLLGLARFEADIGRIQRAADQRMTEVRQYQIGPRSTHSQKLLNELATARRCLLEPHLKAQYDQQLRQGSAAPAAVLPPPAVESSSAIGDPGLSGEGLLPEPAAPMAADSRAEPEVARDPSTRLTPRRRRRKMTQAVMIVVGMVVVAAGLLGAGIWLQNRSASNSAPDGNINRARNATSKPKLVRPPAGGSDADGVVVVQEGAGDIHLPASIAVLHGPTLQLETLPDNSTIVTGWNSKDDWLEWKFQVVKTGIFRVLVVYRTAPDARDGRYRLELDDDSQKSSDVRRRVGDEFVTDEHFLAVKEPGVHRLALRAEQKPGEQLMELKSIELELQVE